MRFMPFVKAMSSALLIRFMRRLIQDTDRKVFLLLDNLRVHHSRPVKKWLRQHKEHIEVFYLPSYSPELNPTEYLNNDLKRRVHSNPPAHCHTELKKTLGALRSIQRRKGQVARCFQHPKVKYAASLLSHKSAIKKA
jgi:transposase